MIKSSSVQATFCYMNFSLCAIDVFSHYLQGEWKPKQIDNPAYKGKWIHPEIDNPDYEADDKLYKYNDFGAIGFDLWQVSILCIWPTVTMLV